MIGLNISIYTFMTSGNFRDIIKRFFIKFSNQVNDKGKHMRKIRKGKR